MEFCIELVCGYGYCKEESQHDDSESSVETLDFFNPTEEPKEMKDPVSTGRKRAAVMYKIEGGQVCEWAWKKNAGGGIEPIIGCTGRPASHIHHGPDKSTLNNERSNISLVCEFCHNRWHVANDKYYSLPRPADNSEWSPSKNIEGRTILPLSAIEKATKQEILINELSIPEGGKDGR
jgi:hypothetical protein